MVCGGVCQTPTYLSGKGKEACQKEFEKQIEIFLKNDVDFLLAEVSLSATHKSNMCKPLVTRKYSQQCISLNLNNLTLQ